MLMISRLDKYIIQEFWFPLLSALGIISGVWLGIDKFKEVFEVISASPYGVSMGILILGLEIPEILSLTLPISILVGSFLSFQKLSGHSEIIAMRASGISYKKIMLPVLFLGLLGAFVTLFLSEFIVPFTVPLSQKISANALNTQASENKLKGFSYVKKSLDGQLEKIFYAKEATPEELSGLLILNFNSGKLEEIYSSARAVWVNEEQSWEMINAKTHKKNSETGKSKFEKSKTLLTKSSSELREILRLSMGYKTMNFMELFRFIELHRSANIDSSQLNESKTSLYKKFSYPFSCVLLALIGSCIGITGRRKIINWGYIGMGLVVFVFFISQSFFDSLGDSGRLSPFFSAWMIDFLLAFMAVYSFWKISK